MRAPFSPNMPEFRPVTSHIWRLTVDWHLGLPLVPPLPVSVWLIRETDEWILVDAGTPEQADTVLQAVSDFLGPARPARIILTHAHYDHGGALAQAIGRWHIPIAAHPAEVDFVTGVRRYRDLESPNWVFRVARAWLREAAWRLPVAQLLNEGDRLGSLEVIHAPGHTPGMIALHHHADRAVLCADAFLHLNNRLAAPPALSTPQPAQARRSMQKLAALDFDVLLPSHDSSERGLAADAVRQALPRL